MMRPCSGSIIFDQKMHNAFKKMAALSVGVPKTI
jgi:hypothetical protein